MPPLTSKTLPETPLKQPRDKSGLRLVVDQGLPQDAAVLLRERGHECIHASDIGMSTAGDGEIVAWAKQQKAIVITLDADFHAILAVSGAREPSVIRIRMQGLGTSAVVELVHRLVIDFTNELLNGTLITVKANKTTCHMLPIGGAD